MDNTIYYGQIDCQATIKNTGQPCTNKAYFSTNCGYLCGIHSKNIKIDKIDEHNKTVDGEYKINKLKGLHGDVISSKISMMKSIPNVKGYLNVFPNFKHGNRKDGLGLAKLSPMSLGPIVDITGKIIANNLENFYQGSKFYAFELDINRNPTMQALQYRETIYMDTVPHRHKYDGRL